MGPREARRLPGGRGPRMKMKRRDFLKTGGIAGTAGLILDGCGKPQQLIPLLVSEDRFVPGEEGWVRTLCQQCSAGCGITVRVMQGESIRTIDGQQKRVKAVQAKKIEGNPGTSRSAWAARARGARPACRCSTIPTAFRRR